MKFLRNLTIYGLVVMTMNLYLPRMIPADDLVPAAKGEFQTWSSDEVAIPQETQKADTEKERSFFSKYKWWIALAVVVIGGGAAAAGGGGGGGGDSSSPPVNDGGGDNIGDNTGSYTATW